MECDASTRFEKHSFPCCPASKLFEDRFKTHFFDACAGCPGMGVGGGRNPAKGQHEAFNFAVAALPGELHLDIWAAHLKAASPEMKDPNGAVIN